jgi:hypothetical protein
MVRLLIYAYARGNRSARGIERARVEDVAYRVVAGDYAQIARAILREAAEIDQREDELYGDSRGDELPEQLRTREGRRQALRNAKEQLNRDATKRPRTTIGSR